MREDLKLCCGCFCPLFGPLREERADESLEHRLSQKEGTLSPWQREDANVEITLASLH